MSLSKKKYLMNQIQENLTDKNSTKVAVIGDSGVGKTSVINSLTNRPFSAIYKKTLCFDVLTKNVSVEPEENKLVTFIDFSGQKNLVYIRKACYSGIDLILAICDVSNPESLYNLENFWLPEFLNYNISISGKIPVVQFIANKFDLVEDGTPFLNTFQEVIKRLQIKYTNLLFIPSTIFFSSNHESSDIISM